MANTAGGESIYHSMMIGVTDSGIGGLNVLAALIKRRCGDDYLYLADGRNLPYGNKRSEQLREIALENARRMERMGANVIVFGCNTLSVTALDYVRKRIKSPVFGLRPRPELLGGGSLMMTTPTTAQYLPGLDPSACLLTPDKLASLIDADYPDLTRVRDYLSPLAIPYAGIRTVYLGCSHYLYAKDVIAELFPSAKITDGVGALAAVIRAVLPTVGRKDPSVSFRFTAKEEQERYALLLTELLG